jgi:hypothetical protein
MIALCMRWSEVIYMTLMNLQSRRTAAEERSRACQPCLAGGLASRLPDGVWLCMERLFYERTVLK